MVLTVLLKMLIPVRRLLWLRRLLVISAVWIFVFVVGLPVSAVRAAIMFSLLMLGSCFTRVGFTLNTLAVAAFGMLLYNPFYLFDVGFQMSFSAVAAILLLQPVTQRLIKPCDNRVMRYFLEIISVSLAAQVGVAPLVMFYFSRFSVYFLLTNIFVVPLAFVIVSLALVLLFAGLLPWKILQLGVGWCIQYIIKIMNIGLAFISTLPGSSIDGFSLSIGELICLYCTLFFLGFWFVKKYRKALVWSLLSVWCGCVLHLYTVLALNQHEVLRIGLSQGRPVIQWLRANEICTLTSDSLRCNVAHVNGVAVMKGKNVCLLNNDYWQNKTTASVFPIDYLYICKGYKGSLMHLLSLFDVQCVILDSSLSEYYRGKLMDECVAGNIKYIDLSAQGNLEVSL